MRHRICILLAFMEEKNGRGMKMKRLIVGGVCLAVILVGCTLELNAGQSSEMDELKKQIEQLKKEKDTPFKDFRRGKGSTGVRDRSRS